MISHLTTLILAFMAFTTSAVPVSESDSNNYNNNTQAYVYFNTDDKCLNSVGSYTISLDDWRSTVCNTDCTDMGVSRYNESKDPVIAVSLSPATSEDRRIRCVFFSAPASECGDGPMTHFVESGDCMPDVNLTSLASMRCNGIDPPMGGAAVCAKY